ncbi:MAG: DUF4340 domain-containing protein [Polyangiales bacterium]
MSQRTTLALLVVALALFAFIVLYERKTLTTPELEGRSSRLVERFVRGRVDRITVEGTHGTVELARDPGEDGELGPWRLVAPLRAAADEEAVESFLSTLEWTEPTRTLEGPSGDDLRRFGLDRPRVKVRLRMLGETSLLALGRDDPSGDGVYAQVVGNAEAHVVGKDVLEALDVDVSHFRDKQLYAGSLEGVDRLEVTTAAGTARLARSGETWKLESPQAMLAANDRVSSVLHALDEALATRFVEESPRDLGRFGLATPSARLRFGTASAPTQHAIALGAPCADHPGERFARADDGPVVCVSSEAMAIVSADPAAYRELRLLPLENADVKRLELRDATSELVIESTAEGHRHTARVGGRDVASGATDAAALADFLDALRAARASTVEPMPAAAPAWDGRLRVSRADGSTFDVAFGPIAGDRFVVRRGDEAVLLVFAASDRSLLDPTPLHLRAASLLRAEASRVAEIVVERAGARETIVPGDASGPRVTAPVSLGADGSRFLDTAARLAALEAVRFVAPSALPSHGLGSPRLVATFRLATADDDGHDHGHARPTETHVLRIGAPSEGGSFATLDADPAVFLVAPALVELLSSPFADRDVFSTDAVFVESLTITVEGRTVALRRDGARFVTDAGPADEARTIDLTSSLADLRADEAVAYGSPSAASGLARPRARIVVQRAAEATEPRRYTILVGASEGEGDAAMTYLAREGLPVTYRVSSSRLARILGYRP